jgi:hypothetical protein
MNSPAVVMSALWGLGDLAEASGEVLEGVAMLREAADLAEQIGYGPEVARIRQRILELTQS